MNCIICGSESYQYFTYKDYLKKNVVIYKCSNCGHGFHNKKYSKKELSSIYNKDYAEQYFGRENEALYKKRILQYQLDIKNLKSLVLDKNYEVLDYGCSTGKYLNHMPKKWKKFGYEVNKTEIEYLKKYEKRIHVYDDLSSINKRFDLITMRGVIEHIQNLPPLIRFLKSKIKNNGYLYITATPDFSCLAATLYKQDWNQITCPSHIQQFSSTSLSFLLAKAGLVLFDLKHDYLSSPYANWKNDRKKFMKNFKKPRGKIDGYHAFPGTMLSALFQKVD